jgi:hypothetical protein
MKGFRQSAASATDSPATLGKLRPEFGFKVGVSGVRAAWTMVLADLTTLLGAAPGEARREDFNRLIVEENILGKRTTNNRWLTAQAP